MQNNKHLFVAITWYIDRFTDKELKCVVAICTSQKDATAMKKCQTILLKKLGHIPWSGFVVKRKVHQINMRAQEIRKQK